MVVGFIPPMIRPAIFWGKRGIGGVGPFDSHDTMNQYQTVSYIEMKLFKTSWIKREMIPFFA